jgi:hypothetical protein
MTAPERGSLRLIYARRTVPPLVLAAGLAAMAYVFDTHDPISAWLVWRYVVVWGLVLLWLAACASLGFALLRLLGATRLPMREVLVFSLAGGVLAWALLTVLVGLVGLISPWTAVLMLVGGLGAGAVPLGRYLRRARRRVLRLRPAHLSLWSRLAIVYGLACLAGLYLNLLTPANIAYDARWYHLPIAEHYATGGRIGAFPEGWFLGALPHLASWLYTWAFTSPGDLFHRLALVMHIELVLFIATALALPVLVDRLLPRPRVAGAWAALFLFPGVMLYDSSLSGGADHVLAFWAAPLFLALLRFWRRPDTLSAVILGAMLGGAALTKYQAVYLVAVPAVAVLIRGARHPRAFLAVAATGLIVTAPHWLLNLVWHGNPIYPYLGGRPFDPGVELNMADPGFAPEGTLAERIIQTLKGVASFGFAAHDWSTFHGTRPVFGSLFLPALAVLPFTRVRRRALGLALATLAGVAIWFWTYHQDRYLQALAPWCAAFVLAVLVSLWREQALAKPVVAAVVGLQVISCADIFFLPTHSMMGTAPIHKTVDLLSAGHRKAFSERDQTFSWGLDEVPKLLPRDAKVLVHEEHIHTGLGRPSVHDTWGKQGGLVYARLGTPRAIARRLRAYGVTHVLWKAAPNNWGRFVDDVAFHGFAQRLAPQVIPNGMRLAPLPAEESLPDALRIAVLGCTNELLEIQQLEAELPRLQQAACAAPSAEAPDLTGVALVLLDVRRHPAPPSAVVASFNLLFGRDGFQVWARR